jgi:hypothetical protein
VIHRRVTGFPHPPIPLAHFRFSIFVLFRFSIFVLLSHTGKSSPFPTNYPGCRTTALYTIHAVKRGQIMYVGGIVWQFLVISLSRSLPLPHELRKYLFFSSCRSH